MSCSRDGDRPRRRYASDDVVRGVTHESNPVKDGDAPSLDGRVGSDATAAREP